MYKYLFKFVQVRKKQIYFPKFEFLINFNKFLEFEAKAYPNW